MPFSDMRRALLAISILLIAVLFFVSSKIAFASQPFERDEGEYAYSAAVILDGGIPYVDTYNMKLPGTYYMYALIIAFFGKGEVPIRIATMFFGLLSAFFVFKIIRLYLDQLSAAFGTTVFLLCMSTMYNEGLLANSEHFVLLFAMPAVYLFLRSSDRNDLFGLFFSGLLFGIALLMKQHAMFYLLFALFFLLLTCLRRAHVWRFLRQSTAILIGFVLPFFYLVYYLKAHHAYEQFYFLTVQYGSAYAAQSNTFVQSILNLLSRIGDQYFLSLSVVACIFLLTKPMKCRAFALWFFVFSFLAVCPGFIFRRHYFMLLSPAVGVLFAFVLRAVDLYFPERAFRIQSWLIGLSMFLFFAAFYPQNFVFSPVMAYNKEYPDQPFTLMHGAADYLKTITQRGEKVGMFSNEPEIYYYADVKAASPFLYNYPLLEGHKYAMSMTDTFIRQIDAISPHVFVRSNANMMVYNQKALDKVDAWWQQRQKDYELKAVLCYMDEARQGKWYKDSDLRSDTSWRSMQRMEFYVKK